MSLTGRPSEPRMMRLLYTDFFPDFPRFLSMDRLYQVARGFAALAPAADFWSLRLVRERSEHIEVRQDVLEPVHSGWSFGAMITLASGGGLGYGATSDLTPSGLTRAASRALAWAKASAGRHLIDPAWLPRPRGSHEDFHLPPRPWASTPLADKIGMLQAASQRLCLDERILDWSAFLSHRHWQSLLVTSDGAEIAQDYEYIHPGLMAVANEGVQTQRRTGGGADRPRRGGLEQLAALGFPGEVEVVAEEALKLLEAPECPQGRMDLLLLPGQMALQIHESIGHPLELDRILGDERNYAGTSFVTLDMFGAYRYGSELLNVTFDPGVPGELASAVADDEGTLAERQFLIRSGILERPLGSRLSQARCGLAGVANARASAWDRPPIDRMANLNLEPGREGLADLIGRVAKGVLMDTNRSWSIDDSRNKFQFGCELGRLIEEGELKGLVRNPGYRGISASFWRSLDGVGAAGCQEIRGVYSCGKGEPNQAIQVGHSSPPALFREVEVFGGGE